MNGNGKLTFANGDTYEGEFKDDMINGKGVFKNKVGNEIKGTFRNGNFTGK
jgi:hypothetical protein